MTSNQPEKNARDSEGFQTKTRAAEDDIVLVEDQPILADDVDDAAQAARSDGSKKSSKTNLPALAATRSSTTAQAPVSTQVGALKSKSSVTDSSVSGSKYGLDDDEILLEYKPFAGTEKWIENRFSSANSTKAWFALGLLLLFFTVGGPAWIIHRLLKQFSLSFPNQISDTTTGFLAQSGSALVLELFFGLSTLLFLIITYIYYSQPTHVRLAADGLSLERRGKKRTVLGNIKWGNLDKVDLYWPAGKTLPQDCLIKFKDKTDHAESKLTLKLGSIIKGSERHELLKAIELFAPDARKDARLLEFLAPVQDHSYTELWLAALSAPPKRERLTPLSEGSTLQNNRYRVLYQLGVGGQGTAYLAIDEEKRAEEIVLKEFILPVYVDTNVLRQSLERMQNEAAMLEKLDNDRIVRLRNFFVEDHRGYLVLEKIDGETLEKIVTTRGPMSEKQAQNLALQMCEILEYLHSLTPPVIHRDFTPDNLILNSDGVLKLVDFNVAQQTESTATGTVVGKHSYLPPEQFRGRPTTQSDIYAMGATLAYLVTGKAPEPIKVSHPREINVDISEEFDKLVAQATAFDTKKRYDSIQTLRTDLKNQIDYEV